MCKHLPGIAASAHGPDGEYSDMGLYVECIDEEPRDDIDAHLDAG